MHALILSLVPLDCFYILFVAVVRIRSVCTF